MPNAWRGKNRSQHIQLEDPADGVGGKIEELQVSAGCGLGLVAARAVNKAIELAKVAYNFLSCLADVFAIKHVALEEGELLAALSKTIDQRLAGFSIHVEDGDFCAAPGKCVGNFAAQNPSAAGDGHGLTREVVHLCQFR